jgi:MarR family transcriptional regulator for hemolysin
MELFRPLRKAALIMTARLSELLAEHHLTVAEWNALDQIYHAQAPLHMGEIARRMLMDTTTMTRVVDALEHRGAALRVSDPKDRRARPVQITDAGRKLFEQTHRLLQQVEREATDHLARNDRLELERLLSSLASNPKPTEGENDGT